MKIENEFIKVEGSVKGNYHRTGDGDSYSAIVEFKTQNGDSFTFTDQIATYPVDYKTGDKVEVLYSASKPEEAMIKSWKRLYLIPTIFFCVGSFPLLFLVIRGQSQYQKKL